MSRRLGGVMCELMGYSFAKPIVADFSIHEFGFRGEENADGWGLAWYPDRSLAIIKDVGKWKSNLHTGFLETYAGIRSRIFVAHVRHMTAGRAVRADTHPFSRELNGVDYCFAHNGTLMNAYKLPLGRFKPIGHTDSEHLFCHLLDTIAHWNKPLADPETWPRLHQQLAEHNRHGTVNVILSDGKHLICYHDATGWKGLHYRYMLIHDQETRRFEDADLRVDLGGGHVNFGIVIATRPLSLTGWSPFLTGEMLVLENGTVRYSSHRANLALAEMTKAS
jgi:predicted glutamine amidotransferase